MVQLPAWGEAAVHQAQPGRTVRGVEGSVGFRGIKGSEFTVRGVSGRDFRVPSLREQFWHRVEGGRT